MPQIINTNIASLNAQRNLNRSQGVLGEALQRLSSGLRINSAKDDAAGLAIAERFTSQVRGLNQAIRNANDGISLAQSAEGALGETSSNIQRIRELALQAANATNSPEDRKALQAEVSALQSEITRVADTTTFNNQKILDGTFTQAQFQVGMNVNETIEVSIQGARSNQLVNESVVSTNATANQGTGSATAAASALPAANTIATQTLTFTSGNGAQTQAITSNSSASDIAAATNSSTGPTGIRATAKTEATLSFSAAAGAISFSLGSTGDSTSVVTSSVTNASDLRDLANAINDVSGTTGISASISTNFASITLKDSNGDDINIENYTATGAGTLDVASADGSTENLASGGTDSTIVTGEVTFNSPEGFTVASSVANTAGSILNTAANTNTASSSSSIADIDVTSVQGANDALAILDSALQRVSSTRADLGAVQNRFETTISNLQTVSENASAARSRIQDADFAAETAKLTRGQILQQAGITVLAQANAVPQSVLSLLQ
ncbi:MAG: flagellin N-terminal helical domain-containing protein [bacterium]